MSADGRGGALRSMGTSTQPLEEPRQESGGLHTYLGMHARFTETVRWLPFCPINSPFLWASMS